MMWRSDELKEFNCVETGREGRVSPFELLLLARVIHGQTALVAQQGTQREKIRWTWQYVIG
jgi:hypothetical protein